MSPFSLLAGTARPPLGRKSVLRHSDRYRIGNVATAEPVDVGCWMVTWRLDPDDLRGTSRLPLSAAIAVYNTALSPNFRMWRLVFC